MTQKVKYTFTAVTARPNPVIGIPEGLELTREQFFEALANARVTRLYLDSNTFAQVNYGFVKKDNTLVADLLPHFPDVSITLLANGEAIMEVSKDSQYQPNAFAIDVEL
ncbi:hypothetical protein [Xanthomonas phage RTH11]|nr:hypothetical protein [Xanthomonas phage RTH11]